MRWGLTSREYTNSVSASVYYYNNFLIVGWKIIYQDQVCGNLQISVSGPLWIYSCFALIQIQSEGDQNADGEDWMPVTIDDTAEMPRRHFQLEGLTPDTQYKLIARAQNGFGWSDYSQVFIFRTAPG